MKRSEMLNHIEYVITDYLGSKINHPDTLALLLLHEFEKIGILPPPHEVEYERNHINEAGLVEKVKMTKEVREWEDEQQ